MTFLKPLATSALALFAPLLLFAQPSFELRIVGLPIVEGTTFVAGQTVSGTVMVAQGGSYPTALARLRVDILDCTGAVTQQQLRNSSCTLNELVIAGEGTVNTTATPVRFNAVLSEAGQVTIRIDAYHLEEPPQYRADNVTTITIPVGLGVPLICEATHDPGNGTLVIDGSQFGTCGTSSKPRVWVNGSELTVVGEPSLTRIQCQVPSSFAGGTISIKVRNTSNKEGTKTINLPAQGSSGTVPTLPPNTSAHYYCTPGQENRYVIPGQEITLTLPVNYTATSVLEYAKLMVGGAVPMHPPASLQTTIKPTNQFVKPAPTVSDPWRPILPVTIPSSPTRTITVRIPAGLTPGSYRIAFNHDHAFHTFIVNAPELYEVMWRPAGTYAGKTEIGMVFHGIMRYPIASAVKLGKGIPGNAYSFEGLMANDPISIPILFQNIGGYPTISNTCDGTTLMLDLPSNFTAYNATGKVYKVQLTTPIGTFLYELPPPIPIR